MDIIVMIYWTAIGLNGTRISTESIVNGIKEDIMILLVYVFLTFLYEQEISLIVGLMCFMIDMSILELVEFIIKRRYK